MWVVIVLTVIAAANTVTQWNNVAWDSARAIGIANWYPVIHSQLVPESRWSFAHGAASVKVIYRMLPIFGCKVVQESSLAGKPVLGMYTVTIKILSTVFPFPLFRIRCFFLLSSTLKYLFAVVLVIPLEGFLSMIWILFVVFALPTQNIFAVVLVMTLAVKAVAFFAMTIKAIRRTLIAIKVFPSRWKIFPTSRTCFGVAHWFVSYWSYIVKGCGQAVGLAVQAVHEAVLAHKLIISQKRVALWT